MIRRQIQRTKHLSTSEEYGMAASKSAYGVEAAGEVPTGCKNIRATVLDPL